MRKPWTEQACKDRRKRTDDRNGRGAGECERGHVERGTGREESCNDEKRRERNGAELGNCLVAIDNYEISQKEDRHPETAPAIDLPAIEVRHEAHEQAGQAPAHGGAEHEQNSRSVSRCAGLHGRRRLRSGPHLCFACRMVISQRLERRLNKKGRASHPASRYAELTVSRGAPCCRDRRGSRE